MSGHKSSSLAPSRRSFLFLCSALIGSAALSGCTSVPRMLYSDPTAPQMPPDLASGFDDYETMYGPVEDEGFQVPGIPWQKIDRQFLRQVVQDPTGEAPGTVVVNTLTHHLYLVQPGGYAVRYGVGLGRAGFEWSGRGVIQWKQKWPKWTPPAEMIARDPKLAKFSQENGGMPGGLTNPLGARANYIFKDGQDTLYRVHGSPEWSSIGKSVSSGCVRMINQDVIDFYDRVKTGAPIIVVGNSPQDEGVEDPISAF